MTLCGDCRPGTEDQIDAQYCTLPARHGGYWHIATIGPAGPGATVIGQWRIRCCPRDTDGDGNCPVHSAPGLLRAR